MNRRPWVSKAAAIAAIGLVLAIPASIWYKARAVRIQIERDLPRIGLIDYYGLRTVTEQQIRAKLLVREGDMAPVDLGEMDAPAFLKSLMKAAWKLTPGQSVLDKGTVISSLEQIPGVAHASLEFVMSGGNSPATLFVGIQETADANTPAFSYRPAPQGSAALPVSMTAAYDDLMNALPGALAKGAQEDDSNGYALHSDPAMRALEDKMIVFAANNTPLLRDVLRNAADPRQRIAAAWIIGYAPDKNAILGDLIDAIRDSEETVRNNSTRAIGVIAEYAALKPELGIRIDPSPFVAMLNSLIWTDRNKATMVLYSLVETNPVETLRQLREKALPSLMDMARWKDDHAWDALELLGRVAGMDEKEIETDRDRNDRQSVIARATAQLNR